MQIGWLVYLLTFQVYMVHERGMQRGRSHAEDWKSAKHNFPLPLMTRVFVSFPEANVFSPSLLLLINADVFPIYIKSIVFVFRQFEFLESHKEIMYFSDVTSSFQITMIVIIKSVHIQKC